MDRTEPAHNLRTDMAEAPEPAKIPRLRHIDGLRGVAILMVVIFHLYVGKVSSGVDIFFFIGGLFAVYSYLRQAQDPQGQSFGGLVMRLLRRLTPTLALVVFATLLIAHRTMAPALWWDLAKEAAASATYCINWVLGLSGNAYSQIDKDPSIFQHLWSMAVQMQVYLVLAVLVYAMVRLLSRWLPAKTVRGWVYAIVATASLVSFAYAMYLHEVNQTLNYYSTYSRFWEIGAGALLGLVLRGAFVFPRAARILASILGVALVSATGMFFNGAEQFPGPLTAIPLAGAALLIMSGKTPRGVHRGWSQIGLTRVLEWQPLVRIGVSAYPLYAWHWGVGLTINAARPDWDLWQRGLATIAVSVVLAELTHRLVELPLQQQRRRRKARRLAPAEKGAWPMMRHLARIGVACVVCGMWLAVIAAPLALREVEAKSFDRLDELARRHGGYGVVFPGAAVAAGDVAPPSVAAVYPSVNVHRTTMHPPNWHDGCYTDMNDDELNFVRDDGEPCVYGDPEARETLYVIGGSHSDQYLSALHEIGLRRGFQVIPIIKLQCPFTSIELSDLEEPEVCERWSEKALDYIVKNPPTLGAFYNSTRPSTTLGMGPDVVPEEYHRVFERLSRAGIRTFAVRDNPWIVMRDAQGQPRNEMMDPKICLSDGWGSDVCGIYRYQALAAINPAVGALRDLPGVRHVDLTEILCPNDWCEPVIGNVLVYRDSNHLTDQFVRTLAPYLEEQMFGREDAKPVPVEPVPVVGELVPVPAEPEAVAGEPVAVS